ncbi:hypothetical protein [Phytoactinopolyspora mesophila]|uniref:CopG family transcriptional regulator n=1 Tax=Phytoactinopolyspora mesophila TaxID=2650750 RepID=A0A7K3M5P8_9ACTN|nr:hypothetical protein [Phytoactinopolyspora mesophila]NDL58649.1 hypothetical protein [Phytoactinopolyspora mesophila]
MARGRNLNLYIRADDEPLWAWAEQEAARRRLALSQFMAMLIERYRDDSEGNES